MRIHADSDTKPWRISTNLGKIGYLELSSLLPVCERREVFYHDPHEQLTSIRLKYEATDDLLVSLQFIPQYALQR
jgi:hypothetical protein